MIVTLRTTVLVVRTLAATVSVMMSSHGVFGHLRVFQPACPAGATFVTTNEPTVRFRERRVPTSCSS